MAITLPQIANPDSIPQQAAPPKPASATAAAKPAKAPSVVDQLLRERRAPERTTKASRLYQKIVDEVGSIQDPLQREFQRVFWEDELTDLFGHPVKIPDPVESEQRDVQRAAAALQAKTEFSKALVKESAIALRTAPAKVKEALFQKLGVEITPDLMERDPQQFLQVAQALDLLISEEDLLRAGIETDPAAREAAARAAGVKERAETSGQIARTIESEAAITKAAGEYAKGDELKRAIGMAESAAGGADIEPGLSNDLDTGAGALAFRKLYQSERTRSPLGEGIVSGAFLSKWGKDLKGHLDLVPRDAQNRLAMMGGSGIMDETDAEATFELSAALLRMAYDQNRPVGAIMQEDMGLKASGIDETGFVAEAIRKAVDSGQDPIKYIRDDLMLPEQAKVAGDLIRAVLSEGGAGG